MDANLTNQHNKYQRMKTKIVLLHADINFLKRFSFYISFYQKIHKMVPEFHSHYLKHCFFVLMKSSKIFLVFNVIYEVGITATTFIFTDLQILMQASKEINALSKCKHF
jgi:hypothetical protein